MNNYWKLIILQKEHFLNEAYYLIFWNYNIIPVLKYVQPRPISLSTQRDILLWETLIIQVISLLVPPPNKPTP